MRDSQKGLFKFCRKYLKANPSSQRAQCGIPSTSHELREERAHPRRAVNGRVAHVTAAAPHWRKDPETATAACLEKQKGTGMGLLGEAALATDSLAGFRLQKMELVLQSETDDLLHQLCCSMGWSGDGLTGGSAKDDGVCWRDGDFQSYARCCFSRLRELAQAPAPRWMRREISNDGGMRHGESMDRVEERLGHIYCRFRIIRGQLHTCDPQRIEVLKDGDASGEPWGQYQAMARAMRLFIALDLLPDLDVFVSPNIYDQESPPVPVLTKARTVFAQNLFRVPSYELIGPLLDRIRTELAAIPWDDKEPRLFWRGGMRSFNRCSCDPRQAQWPGLWRNFSQLLENEGVGPCGCTRLITNVSSFELCNRVRLCEIGGKYPHLVDAKLAYIPASYDSIRGLAEERGYVADYTQPSQQLRYKYLISTDGSTIDDTRIYWMLSSGSLVFKQITPLLPFGLPALQPWKHFVPVKEDFSDLVEKVEWARANDDACRAMAARAGDFARSFFTEEEILHYVYRVLRQVVDTD
eukprot:s1788_g5.t1